MTSFSVDIPYNKVTLPAIGIIGLGIECFSFSHKIKKKSIIVFFAVESDAMEFLDLLALHVHDTLPTKNRQDVDHKSTNPSP